MKGRRAIAWIAMCLLLPFFSGCGSGAIEVDPASSTLQTAGDSSGSQPTVSSSQPGPSQALPISQPLTGPCGDLCQRVGGCTSAWTAPDGCARECEAMQKVVRPVVVELYSSCGAQASCSTFDKKVCLREGSNPVPLQLTLGLVDTLCAKLATCLGEAMQPSDCDNLKKDPAMIALLEQLKIYIDPVFVCTAGCLQRQSCTALFQGGITILRQCAEPCGTRSDWAFD